jgi:hypothetical protein
MPAIEIEDSGLIYANPKPHLRSRQATFPTVIRLPSGALLAAFMVGEAFESADGHTELARSIDEGQTWEQLGPLPVGPTPHPVSESGRLSLAADGTVLCYGPRFDRSDPERSIGNAATNGLIDCEAVLYRSRDEGRSWSSPAVLPIPLPGPYEIASPIVVLSDGRWLAPLSTWRNWEGEKLAGEKALALVSHDGGRGWNELLEVFADPEDQITYWEQRIFAIGGGRLMATAWAHDHRSGADLPNQFVIAEDGRTFGPPRSTGQPGQTCSPLWLGDDRLLSVYNHRHGDPGVRAALVRFTAEEWQAETEVVLWGQGTPRVGGTTSIVGAMNQFRFGFPGVLALGDQRYLVSHWCMEDAQLVSRWTRIRVEW